jgi:hypothetical protein
MNPHQQEVITLAKTPTPMLIRDNLVIDVKLFSGHPTKRAIE